RDGLPVRGPRRRLIGPAAVHCHLETGCSAAWQRATFGTWRPRVQIPASRQQMTAKPTGRRGWLLSGDFGRFWLGQTGFNLGGPFPFLPLPPLGVNLTGSPLNLGRATAMEFVPSLLFGLVIGAWVDRVDRKRLMIATDLGRAAVIAVIPGLDALEAVAVGWVYAVAFCSATLTIAFDAAQFAAIPSLVPSGDD